MRYRQLVSTVAGVYGSSGSSNGLGTYARFSQPLGVAVDANSNVYVADSDNNLIRKISSSGVVSTYAGSSQGSSNGYGTYASFYYPRGVAVDSSSNIYVSDSDNHAIRKIDASGLVSTFAGRIGTSGSSNGLGTYASFNYPWGLCMGFYGVDVYVADTGNNLIRKIASSGLVSTYAGVAGSSGSSNGLSTYATFNNPYAICFDASGNAFVADNSNNAIRKISSSGAVTTLAGGSQGSVNGVGTYAQFYFPHGVAVDGSGNVYVADFYNSLIRLISSSGVVSTYAGSGVAGGTNGLGTFASFWGSYSVALDSSGYVYVADYLGYLIRKIR